MADPRFKPGFLPGQARWPNIITGARMALMPFVLATVVAGSRTGFIALLAVALATDALDGFLARRFNACTELGRKLDSLADNLMMLAGTTGILVLWLEIARREWPWIITLLAAFLAIALYGLVAKGRAPCYHTWASKGLGVAGGLSLVPLLAGWSAAPFHWVTVLQVLTGIEEFVIVALVPAHVGEMPTAWHAWRLRRGHPVRSTVAKGIADPAAQQTGRPARPGGL